MNAPFKPKFNGSNFIVVNVTRMSLAWHEEIRCVCEDVRNFQTISTHQYGLACSDMSATSRACWNSWNLENDTI